MDTLLPAPSATAFDAVSALVSAAVYGLVALAALAQAPRDARVRVFLATAIASVAPYCVTAVIWTRGSQAAWSKGIIVVVGLSLMLGSLALFHFTQLFPWRRPWIRAYGSRLWAGYAAVIASTAVAALVTPSFDVETSGSGGLGAVSAGTAEIAALFILALVVPVIFVIGVVIPLGGLLSLYKSWLAARAHGIEPARVTTLWMLISQMGGGVLTILIIPLLRFVAPAGPWVTMAAALLFACGLLMPIAFAVGVWRLGVLALDIDALPQ